MKLIKFKCEDASINNNQSNMPFRKNNNYRLGDDLICSPTNDMPCL